MKTLIIVRHGAFDHSNTQITDSDHPLTRDGRRQTEEMARQFARLDIYPDLLVSSTAKRAIETAKIYAKRLKIPAASIRIKKNIFEAERSEILRVVQSIDDTASTILLIGHHPAVTNLLQHLVDSDIEKMSLASLAVLELSTESWRTISFKQGELVKYLEPKESENSKAWWKRIIFWRH